MFVSHGLYFNHFLFVTRFQVPSILFYSSDFSVVAVG